MEFLLKLSSNRIEPGKLDASPQIINKFHIKCCLQCQTFVRQNIPEVKKSTFECQSMNSPHQSTSLAWKPNMETNITLLLPKGNIISLFFSSVIFRCWNYEIRS